MVLCHLAELLKTSATTQLVVSL